MLHQNIRTLANLIGVALIGVIVLSAALRVA
jgi:hypothetical protein